MRMRGSSLPWLLVVLLPPLSSAGHSLRYRNIESIKEKFLQMVATEAAERVQQGLPPPVATVLDVGANIGTFSDFMMTRLRRMAPNVNSRLIMFEPQQQLHAQLSILVAQWHGVLVPAAAWTHNTSLTFHLTNNSESASLMNNIDWKDGRKWTAVTVPAIDLAERLLHELPRAAARENNESIVFFKFDVEGAEFEVLPRLISTRVLCRVRFLLIEWHIKNLPPEKRAAGLAMKEALAGILASSCRTPPELVHDDMPLNNALPMDTPGLDGKAALIETFRAQMVTALRESNARRAQAPPRLGSRRHVPGRQLAVQQARSAAFPCQECPQGARVAATAATFGVCMLTPVHEPHFAALASRINSTLELAIGEPPTTIVVFDDDTAEHTFCARFSGACESRHVVRTNLRTLLGERQYSVARPVLSPRPPYPAQLGTKPRTRPLNRHGAEIVAIEGKVAKDTLLLTLCIQAEILDDRRRAQVVEDIHERRSRVLFDAPALGKAWLLSCASQVPVRPHNAAES